MTHEPTYFSQEINMEQFLKEMQIKEQQRSFQVSRRKREQEKPVLKKAGLQSFLLQTL